MSNEKKNVTEKPVEVKPEQVKKEAVEKQVVNESVKENTKEPVKEVVSEKKVSEPVKSTTPSISVGDTVMLKDTATTTVNGSKIPEFAYRNTYKVIKITGNRVIIRAGLVYTIAVKATDLKKK